MADIMADSSLIMVDSYLIMADYGRNLIAKFKQESRPGIWIMVERKTNESN